MTEDRGRWGCPVSTCANADGDYGTLMQKGRDKVCDTCGHVVRGYRSPPELGYKRFKIGKALARAYPGWGARHWLTKPVGFVKDDHAKILVVPTTLGKVLAHVMLPLFILMEGLPDVIRDWPRDVWQPIKYGSGRGEDIHRQWDEEFFDEVTGGS